jgi:hypothetical protein
MKCPGLPKWLVIGFALLLAGGGLPGAAAQDVESGRATRVVALLPMVGPIGPATTDLVRRGL